jgi:hypothetical protein
VKVGDYIVDAEWIETDGDWFRAIDVGTKNTETPIKRFKRRCVLAQWGVSVERVQLSASQTDRLIATWSAGVGLARRAAA